MLNEYFTADEVADILDIDECSAAEMLNGILEMEADELLELAEFIEISTDKLLKS